MASLRTALCRALAVAAAVAAAACTEASAGGDPRTVADTVDAGGGRRSELMYALNPDRPLSDRQPLHPLWRASATGWKEPVALAATPQRLLVLDARARRIWSLWLDDGRTGPAMGHALSPREPRYIAYSRGFTIVGDSAAGSATLLSASGDLIWSRSADPGQDVAATGDGHLALEPTADLSWEWLVVWPERDTRPLHLPEGPAGPQREWCRRVSEGPFLLQASCTHPVVQLLGADGKVQRTLGILRPRPDSAPRMSDDSRASRVNPATEGTVLGARYDPVSARLVIWSRGPHSGNVVDVLSREGVYLARADVPTPWRDLQFRGGVLYALEKPRGERPVVAAYRVVLPGDSVPAPRRRTRRGTP